MLDEISVICLSAMGKFHADTYTRRVLIVFKNNLRDTPQNINFI